MNDNTQMTSAPGASLIPSGVSALTTVHFVIIAIFAALVVVGLIWGMRLKHRRTSAAREVIRDNEEVARTPEQVEQNDAPPPAAISDAPPSPPVVANTPTVETPPGSLPLHDTPIAATAPLEASPTLEAATAPNNSAAISDDTAIPVTKLKGLGPKVAARLGELGISDARQLAALDDKQAADLDDALGSFSGRMARDRWVEQARLLSTGDLAGYEAIFGKL